MKAIADITDYHEAADILSQEFAELNIPVKIHGGHLATGDDGWKHFAWQVEYTNPTSKKSILLDWKAGTGHVTQTRFDKIYRLPGKPTPPKPAEVLAAVCREYLDAREPFEEWAANFGYDSDSRAAERIYFTCQGHKRNLDTLGLTFAQVRRFAELSALL